MNQKIQALLVNKARYTINRNFNNLVEQITRYNEKGLKVSEEFPTDTGSTVNKFYYDNNNNLITEKDDERISTYKYNDKNELIEFENEYILTGKKVNTIYSYNEKGQRIKSVTKHSDDDTFIINDYTYNEKGDKVKQCRNVSDKYFSEYLFYYDDNHNKIREVCKGSEGYQGYGSYRGHELLYSYNENGNKTYHKSPEREEWYTYDNNGLLIGFRDTENHEYGFEYK